MNLPASVRPLFQKTIALGISLRHQFSGEQGRPSDDQEDRLERAAALLRGLDAGDLEVVDDILPRLVEWKGGK